MPISLSMHDFLDSRREAAQGVIDLLLGALGDPRRIEDASFSQLSGALGVVIDRFSRAAASEQSLQRLDALLREFRDAAQSETA